VHLLAKSFVRTESLSGSLISIGNTGVVAYTGFFFKYFDFPVLSFHLPSTLRSLVTDSASVRKERLRGGFGTDGRVICEIWTEFNPLGLQSSKGLLETLQCVFRFRVAYSTVKFTLCWSHTYMHLYLKRITGNIFGFSCVCVCVCVCVRARACVCVCVFVCIVTGETWRSLVRSISRPNLWSSLWLRSAQVFVVHTAS
jgi:hypothetical protein